MSNNKNSEIEIYININNKKEKIKINLNKSVDEIAYNFSKENNLTFNKMQILKKNINNELFKQFQNGKIIFNNNKNKTNFNNKNIKKNNDKNNNKNYGEYLYKKGKEYLSKKENEINLIKNSYENDLKKKLTFKPKINKSFSLITILTNNYKTPKLKSIRKKTLNNNNKTTFSFHPKINNNIIIHSSFTERLKNSLSKNKNIITNYSNIYNDWFKPKINNIKTSRENKTKKEIFELNYNYSKIYNNKKEKLKNNFYFNNKQKLIKNNSNEIFIEKKIKSFVYIFKLIDKDEDNLISYLNLNLKNLDKKLNKILAPIFQNLILQKATMNLNDFIKAMNFLFKNLQFDEKQLILNISNNNNNKNKHNRINSI